MVSANNNESRPLENQVLRSSSSLLQGKELDIERIFFIVVRRWPIIILSVLLAFLASGIYLRYAIPKYAATTRLLIKDTRYSGGMSEAMVFEDLGILGDTRNLDNEIQILRTTFLMEEVVKRLKLQFKYESQGRVSTREYYKETPVTVISWEPFEKYNAKVIQLNVRLQEDDNYTLEIEEKSFKGRLGQAVKLPYGSLTLGIPDYQEALRQSDSRDVLITLRPISVAANIYSSQLSVTFDTKTRSTVLELKLVDANYKKAVDILQELINVYNETEIADKNRIFKNTVKFIDERMAILGSELRAVEGDVASFRSQTGAINLAGEGAILMTENSQRSNELTAMEAQLEISKAIREQLLREGSKFEFVPTSDGLSSQALLSLLNTFNQLLLERERLINRFGPKHPDIELIERQLNNLRQNIVESINGSERDLLIRKSALAKKEKEIDRRMRVIPNTEKQLLEIQRQQAIKQQLYLYLLQKREEAALSLSVTVANNRIIEPARFAGQVSPKVKQVRLIAISLGLLIPIGLLLLLNGLNRQIMTEDQITSQTSTPIIGTIPFTANKNHIVVSDGKRSAAAEMFRLIRAQFQYIGNGVDNRIIALTSSVSGEGKSFVALNLGLTLALAKKKVVVVELDLRKPKLSKYLGFKSGSRRGITDYLVDPSLKETDIVAKSDINENLYYISSGPLPPNPSELLLGERIGLLLKRLGEQFDFVLLDTPPVGLVSDALLLGKHIDATFYIVRQGVTQQRQLKIAEELNTSGKMPRTFILFNGIKFGAGGYGYGSGYGYGYGYNYGYGYGYYADDGKHIPKWKKILGFKK